MRNRSFHAFSSFFHRRSCPSHAPFPDCVAPGAGNQSAQGVVPAGVTRLAGPWPDFLRDCRALGDVITFIRRPGALLVSGGPVPELSCSSDGAWAANRDRLLALDFTRWESVWAIEEEERRSVTVRNPDGTAGFGLTFGPWTSPVAYEELMEKYHAPGPGKEFQGIQTVPWKLKLRNRAAWLREQAPCGQAALPPALLGRIFEQALALGLTLRTGVCNDLAIHRPCWRFTETGTQGTQLWAVSPCAGLRVSLPEMGETWLVGGRCPCCGEDRLTVETYDRHDQLALTLQVTSDDDEVLWRALLAEVCQMP